MFDTARISRQQPANTKFHVRLQVRTTRLGVPYVRPVVRLTTLTGARL